MSREQLQQKLEQAQKFLSTLQNETSYADLMEAFALLIEKRNEALSAAEKAEYEANIIEHLCEEFEDKNMAHMAKTVLTNAKTWWTNSGSTCLCKNGTKFMPFEAYMKLTAAVLQKIIPLQHIIGIQALQGPVGLIYRLAYQVHKPQKEKQLQTNQIPPLNPEPVKPSVSSLFDAATDTTKIELSVISQAVQSATCKLAAGWTIEAKQDLQELHNIDVEKELVKALSSEIAHEYGQHVIRDLKRLAGMNPEFTLKWNNTLGTTKENIQSLYVKLHQAASDIAMKTRRGAGNVIITSPMGVAFLTQDIAYKFVANEDSSENSLNNPVAHAGDLCYITKSGETEEQSVNPQVAFTVLSSLDLVSDDDSILFLVGYKGKNGEADAGYFLTPYVPVISSGVVVDPISSQPIVSLMTRFGKAIFSDPDVEVGGNSEHYFRMVRWEGVNFLGEDSTTP